MPELTITSAADYRAQRTRIVALPTGPVWKLRMIDPLLVFDGAAGMHNPLLGQIAGLVKQRDPEQAGAAAARDPEMLVALRERLNTLMIKALVEPGLIQQGVEDGLDVDEISLEDKLAVFTELLGGMEAVDSAKLFPGQQGADLGTTPAGEDLRPTPGDAGSD